MRNKELFNGAFLMADEGEFYSDEDELGGNIGPEFEEGVGYPTDDDSYMFK